MLLGNPLNANAWNTSDFENYNRIFYDNNNDIYYGVNITSNKLGISVYKITSTENILLFTRSYSQYNDSTKEVELGNGSCKIAEVCYLKSFNSICILGSYDYDNRYIYISLLNLNNLTLSPYKKLYIYEKGSVYDDVYGDMNVATPYISTGSDIPIAWGFDDRIIWIGSEDICTDIMMYNLTSDTLSVVYNITGTFSLEYDDITYEPIIRDETNVGRIRIAVSESSNIISLLILSQWETNADYATYFYIHYDVNLISIYKDTNVITKTLEAICSTSDCPDNSWYITAPSISCYDYENNKFIFSYTFYRGSGSYINLARFDPTIENSDWYGEGNGIKSITKSINNFKDFFLNVLVLRNKLYTVISYINSNEIYIREDTIDNLMSNSSIYDNLIQLNNSIGMTLCNYGGIIYPNQSSIVYMCIYAENYDTSVQQIGCAKFCSSIPLIDEEGMNAFIKVKN